MSIVNVNRPINSNMKFMVSTEIPPIVENINAASFARMGCGKPSKYSIYNPANYVVGMKGFRFACLHNDKEVFAFAEIIISQRIRPSGVVGNLTNKYAEIYNVCTHSNYRGRGIGKRLMDEIVKHFSELRYEEIYLGVLLNQSNQDFLSRIKMYAKSGFVSKINSSRTLRSKPNSAAPEHVTMVYRKNFKNHMTKNTLIEKAIEKAQMFKRSYNNSKTYFRSVNVKVRFSADEIRKMKQIRSLNVEVGGLVKLSNRKFNRGEKSYKFNGEFTKPLYGNPNNVFSTLIPNSNISQKMILPWHTHPTICYRKLGSCLGFPSTPDMKVYFQRTLNNGEFAHLIFTEEGIYLCGMYLSAIDFMVNFKQESATYAIISALIDGVLGPFNANMKWKHMRNAGLEVNTSGPSLGGPKTILQYIANKNTKRNFVMNRLGNYNPNVARVILSSWLNLLHRITIGIFCMEYLKSCNPATNTMLCQLARSNVNNPNPIFFTTLQETDYNSDIEISIPYDLYTMKTHLKKNRV